MPGRRNLQRELAAHRLESPQRQAATYDMLRAAFPDHALIGRPAILQWLSTFGVRRLNGGPLTWRIVNRWRVLDACPILRGMHHARDKTWAITTSHALTSWLLTRFYHGHLFRVVDNAQAFAPCGSFPATQQRAA